MGLVSQWWDAVDWACVLCDRRIHNDWTCRSANLHQVLIQTWTFIHRNYSGFWGWFCDWSPGKIVVPTLQRWLEICGKRSTFWKACNKQNTWKHWMCVGCNQWKLAIDCARIRISTGDSTDYCFRDFGGGSLQETWRQNLFRGSCHKSRRNFILKLHRTCLKPLTKTQISPKKS